MVCFHSLLQLILDMAKSVNSSDSVSKLRQINQFQKNKKTCGSQNHSTSAIIDVIILIAVVGACGFLMYPYAKFLSHKAVQLTGEVMEMVIEEIVLAPMVFGCLGLSIFFAVTALVAIVLCTDTKCGKIGCRGLRKGAEFDIQLKKSNFITKNSASKTGLFELPRYHHSELEAELKKMAPPNGTAVLIFRARCGCSVGRMEVPGPTKARKVKK